MFSRRAILLTAVSCLAAGYAVRAFVGVGRGEPDVDQDPEGEPEEDTVDELFLCAISPIGALCANLRGRIGGSALVTTARHLRRCRAKRHRGKGAAVPVASLPDDPGLGDSTCESTASYGSVNLPITPAEARNIHYRLEKQTPPV
jgi:hypothetical protein